MTLAIGLVILAFVLVMAELTFPSFGLLSLCAAAAYAFALVEAFGLSSRFGWTLVGAGVILLPVAILLGLKLLPATPMGRRLFLRQPTRDEIQRGTRPAEESALVGHVGRALTDLRPAGTADVDGQRVDVVANGRFLSRGTAIRVVSSGGGRLLVEPLPGDPRT